MEQPEVLEWLAAAGQVLDADPDDGASHDRQLGVGWPAGPVPTTAEFLVHAAPGMDPYRAVAGGQGGEFVVGRRTAVGVGQGQFGPVPAGGSPLAGWAVAGVGVEDPLAVESGQHLHVLVGQLVGQGARVVARVQNHQWRRAWRGSTQDEVPQPMPTTTL